MVEFITEINLRLSDLFRFKISLDNKYAAYGNCELRLIRKKGNRCVANFLIKEVEANSGKNINEIIMRLCHLREQRGIL